MRTQRLGSAGLIGIAAVVFCALAPAAAQETEGFRHRGWIGARLENDKDDGCAMALEVRRNVGLVVYANAKRGFKIGLANADWRLEPGKEALAAATFGSSPPLVLKGSAVSRTTILFEPLVALEEGELPTLIEQSRSIRLTYDRIYLNARLSGSSRAIRALWACAQASPPERTARREDQADDAEGQAGGGRAADFAFLRQNMPAAEAEKRLLEAGWQAETGEGRPAPSAPPPAAYRDLGVSAAPSCSGAPPTCALDYLDAFGNALRLTASGDGEPTLRRWRLNPPEEPSGEAEEASGDAEGAEGGAAAPR